MEIKQKFHDYRLWEDFQHGMYTTDIRNEGSDELVLLGKALLASPEELHNAMWNVVSEWKIAAEVNLTNNGCNKRAWLGQAACSLTHNVPEILTRQSWGMLTDDERIAANKVADQIIQLWTDNYTSQFKNYGQTTLGI